MTSLPDPRHADLPAADEVAAEARVTAELMEELGRVIVGQRAMLDRLLIGLLADGHVLLEGVPGLAKTLAVRTLAASIDAGFHRIQFTPDLLPADLIGTMIYNQRSGEFTVQQGPIFTNLLLADEINRAPAKVQSALLEAMQEKQVTIGGTTFKLEEPFLVLATQNPIEQEGTYPLPEAQVDRFMLKLRVGYPSRDEEKEIMKRMAGGEPIAIQHVATPQAIMEARSRIAELYMDDRIMDYIVDIVHTTREPSSAGLQDLAALIEFGASPRATISLAQASRAHAFLRGRAFVTPDDVKAIAPDVLRHRVLTTYEAEAEEVTSDQIV
ncbi:MAG TPA: AAA family ATPase, partial [Phycisphaerales bacterium]|nr:AAA family ATPase [Phycisphaerales bacterium]